MQSYAQYFLIAATVWGVIAMTLLLTAWWCAYQRCCKWHRRLMIFLTIGAWLFLLSYMIRYYTPGNTPPAIPTHLSLWFAIHGTMGMFSLISVTLVVWSRVSRGQWSRNLHQHFNRHHILYGRILVVVWTLTHMGGIANYWLLM